MTELDILRERFSNDLFATEQCGIRIEEASEGRVRCSMEITRQHENMSGYVMGGAVFTLADLAASALANMNRPINVTQSSQITYLRPASGSVLYAEAVMPFSGRTSGYAEVSVKDENGKEVARANFLFHQVRTGNE